MKAENYKLKVVNETEENISELISFKPYEKFEKLIGFIVGGATILRPTGFKDKDGTYVYEGDLISCCFDEDTSVRGIVTYGEYKNPFDDTHTSHIGFYIDFKDYKHKDNIRKDLGFWLKISSVCGNIYNNN